MWFECLEGGLGIPLNFDMKFMGPIDETMLRDAIGIKD